MERTEIKNIIEAILFASGDPVSIERLCVILETPRDIVETLIAELKASYDYERRGMKLVRLEDNVQLCTRGDYADYVRLALETRRPSSLTPAALEILSIVAYRQPVTRVFIEQVRGVDSSYTLGSLCEKGLVAECGHLDAPGRPNLYKTTENFLRCFGLSSLNDLPDIPELSLPAEGQLAMRQAGS
jgi:segregation and condensation protein B